MLNKENAPKYLIAAHDKALAVSNELKKVRCELQKADIDRDQRPKLKAKIENLEAEWMPLAKMESLAMAIAKLGVDDSIIAEFAKALKPKPDPAKLGKLPVKKKVK